MAALPMDLVRRRCDFQYMQQETEREISLLEKYKSRIREKVLVSL